MVPDHQEVASSRAWIADGILRPSGIAALDVAAHESVHAFALCLQKTLILPALSLAYAWIDAMGALTGRDGSASKIAFTSWLGRFGAKLLQEHEVSAIDVYAARCGVLHTLSAASSLSKQGKAKKLCYAHGEANAQMLQRLSERLGYSTMRVLHLEDVGALSYRSTNEFFLELKVNRTLFELVDQRVSAGFFATVPAERVTAMLMRAERSDRTIEGTTAPSAAEE